MPVAVVHVGIVRVLVAHRFMPVPVRMRLGHCAVMGMLMVLVMGMGMIVLQSLVIVLVVMPLGQVEP